MKMNATMFFCIAICIAICMAFTSAHPVLQQNQLLNNHAESESDVNKQMVNTQTCSHDPQTLLATCNVKELLEAHRASTGTTLINSVNPAQQQTAEISAAGGRCRIVIVIFHEPGADRENLVCIFILLRSVQPAVLASDPIHNTIAQQTGIDYGKLPRCEMLPNGELKCPF